MKKFAQWHELQPINQLDDNDLKLLYESSEIRELEPRTLLTLDPGEMIYLLEGEVSLLSGGFVFETFNHVDQRAQEPLFNESLDEDSAVLTSHGSILTVPRELFDGLMQQHQEAVVEYPELGLNESENELYASLLRAFKYKKLELPALPDTALKIRKVISAPGVSSDQVVQIVQNDPVLSARLIKIANSPLYGTWREIKSIRDAVRRLGLETTKNLSFSLSVKQLFSARTSAIREKVHELYEDSLAVAAIAYVITQQRMPRLDPEHALLIGLVQNLGLIPILKYIDEHPAMMKSVDELGKSLEKLKLPISQLIFEEWNFDPVFMEIVEQEQSWYRDTGAEADYCDIIIAARLLYLDSQQRAPVDDLKSLPIISKLQLLENDDDGHYFMDKAMNEVGELQSLLQSA